MVLSPEKMFELEEGSTNITVNLHLDRLQGTKEKLGPEKLGSLIR